MIYYSEMCKFLVKVAQCVAVHLTQLAINGKLVD
jgi:hypothetical protein